MASRWYYQSNGEQFGPVNVDELKQLAAAGRLLPTDRVRKEDMGKWVRATSVRGLVLPVAAGPQPDGDSPAAFDFFGDGPGADEPPAAAEPAPEYLPEFDFFGADAPAAPPTPAPSPRATRLQRAKPLVLSPPAPAPDPAPVAEPVPAEPEGDGSAFRFTDAAAPATEPVPAEPAPFASFAAQAPPIPFATPVDDGPAPPPTPAVAEPSPAPAAPPAAPPAAVAPPAPVPVPPVELTGPAVDLRPDGTATLPGGQTSLRLTAGWLVARTTPPDGPDRETYLRLSRLEAAVLTTRPEAEPLARLRGMTSHRVLSFHAAGQTVAVAVAGDEGPCRAFLERVVGGRMDGRINPRRRAV
jgi:hypothetical protein